MKQSQPNQKQVHGNHSAGVNDKDTPRSPHTDSSEKRQKERREGCSLCGKKGCCKDDHRFHGMLIGMGF